MSQLLARIAKMSSRGLCFRSVSTAATPYLLGQPRVTSEITLDCEPLVELNLYDPRKDETVILPEQTLTKEIRQAIKVGSSRGWVAGMNLIHNSYHLTNMFNPCASLSSRKVISLPPTKEDSICDISLSASPDQEDCVVAALTEDRTDLFMCRPGDSEWTSIKIPFHPAEMIYSERDGQFYLDMDSADQNNAPIDLLDTSSGFPQVTLIDPSSHFSESLQEQLSLEDPFSYPYPYHTSQYIVESPFGESFLVHRFKTKEPPPPSSWEIKPKAFVVFRLDPEQWVSSYTQDIGDLCIFLGFNEAFCLSATEYPGLKPNSIYFVDGSGFGFYDLSSHTLHASLNPPPFNPVSLWLAPLQ